MINEKQKVELIAAIARKDITAIKHLINTISHTTIIGHNLDGTPIIPSAEDRLISLAYKVSGVKRETIVITGDLLR